MNSLLSNVNALNTRSLLLLQQNSHKEAICCLRMGVKSIVNKIVDPESDDRFSSLQPQCDESFYEYSQAPKCVDDDMDVEQEVSSIHTVAIPEIPNSDTSAVSPDNVSVVFNRAFYLPPQEDGGSHPAVYSTKLSATLLYNMGLAWHHLGFQENSSAALKRALFVYEQAYRSLSQQAVGKSSHLLLLALANNMAHIHTHFVDVDAARQCREVVTQLLVNYFPAVASKVSGEYAFFTAEVMLFECQELSFAPAA